MVVVAGFPSVVEFSPHRQFFFSKVYVDYLLVFCGSSFPLSFPFFPAGPNPVFFLNMLSESFSVP